MGANKVDRKEQMLGYLFIVPAVVYMLIFIGYPIIYKRCQGFPGICQLPGGICRCNLQEGLGAYFCIHGRMPSNPVFSGIFICHVFCEKVYLFQTDPRLYRNQLDASCNGNGFGI